MERGINRGYQLSLETGVTRGRERCYPCPKPKPRPKRTLSVDSAGGHKSILITQIYVNIEQMAYTERCDEYHVKVAGSVEDAAKLLEQGFDYVCEMEGKKLFRKRKEKI